MAKRVAKELGLPLLIKDDIKDAAFDSLGWSDRDWSKKIGGMSFAVMYRLLEAQLALGLSLVVETAFNPKMDSLNFKGIQQRLPFKPIQICLTADHEVLFRRFIERAQGPDRHPGHVDENADREGFLRRLSEPPYSALKIEGPVIGVDTTDFNLVDVEGIIKRVQELMAR